MSDRRIYQSNSSSSSLEPLIIERKPRNQSPPGSPRRRRVSFSLNPFKNLRSTVVTKESTIRSRRRRERRSRTPSPSPSPPRGPDHAMDPRLGDNYTPLPKKLPHKEDKSSSSEEEHKKKPRRRKPKIIQEDHPDDRDAFPHVESPSSLSPRSRDSPRRRDSGIYSMEGSPRPRYYDAYGRPTYAPASTEERVKDLANQFNNIITKERLEKVELEKEVVRAKEDVLQAKEEVQRVKRQSLIEERERKVSDRERQHRDEQRGITDTPAPVHRDVIVIQPRPPVRLDPSADAHNRAREDFKKRRGGGYQQ